ncbi:MAG: wobble nucleotide-excising tRNase, partial [Candidatus Omnitrophota bacterium]
SDAMEHINQILKKFFGDSFIYLDVSESKDGEIGYVLKRRGNNAKYLSEGEKSILALAYFLVKLEEDGFDKRNGIVIIDDPVDSQDSVFLFRTFGLLKSYLANSKQLIIMTHNYELFNLTRDWFNLKGFKRKANFYLIERSKENDQEIVSLEDLPVLLKEYKSEYQYLFSRLYQHTKEQNKLDAPLVANVARKVIEYFSAFKWACNSNDKLYDLILSRFIADDNELKKSTGEYICKFINEYSHGQEFSRDITASLFEANTIAENVINFIKYADSDHCTELLSLCDDLLGMSDDNLEEPQETDNLIEGATD